MKSRTAPTSSAARTIPATQPTALPAALTRDQLLEIYYYLRLTRTLEERLVALYRQSKVIGVYSAVIDLPDGEAEVDFDDDSVTTDQLVAAVAQAGYGAKVAG